MAAYTARSSGRRSDGGAELSELAREKLRVKRLKAPLVEIDSLQTNTRKLLMRRITNDKLPRERRRQVRVDSVRATLCTRSRTSTGKRSQAFGPPSSSLCNQDSRSDRSSSTRFNMALRMPNAGPGLFKEGYKVCRHGAQ